MSEQSAIDPERPHNRPCVEFCRGAGWCWCWCHDIIPRPTSGGRLLDGRADARIDSLHGGGAFH